MIVLILLFPLFIYGHNPENLIFDWIWIGNENELYFKMDLTEDVAFDDLYTVYSNEKGQTCEISCTPKNPIFTPKGYQLKNVSIEVTIENTESAREVFYKIHVYTSYWTHNKEGERSVLVIDYSHEDFLINPTLDLNTEPLFYSFLDDSTAGVVRFQNLFRSKD